MVEARIPIRETFEKAVRASGGLPVTDLLPSRVNLPKNADYVFRQENVYIQITLVETIAKAVMIARSALGEAIARGSKSSVVRFVGEYRNNSDGRVFAYSMRPNNSDHVFSVLAPVLGLVLPEPVVVEPSKVKAQPKRTAVKAA